MCSNLSDPAYLKRVLDDNKIAYDDTAVEKLIRYYSLVVHKNEVMNLTAITDFEEFCVKHFADSLSLSRVIDPSGCSVIDIGTGAGFPGIPLKILYPDIRLTLLDSLNKRIEFLKDVVSELGLKDVTCIHGRAEEFGRKPEYRECYDIAVSRAVANLSTLVEYSLPFVKVGGCFVSYKGAKSQEEISSGLNAIKLLGGAKPISNEFTLIGADSERNLIRIDKIKPTSSTYPRAGGKPVKSPL